MKTLSPQRQMELAHNLVALVNVRLMELDSLHNKYSMKIRMCRDNWKLQNYREQIVTIERSIEINKTILGIKNEA